MLHIIHKKVGVFLSIESTCVYTMNMRERLIHHFYWHFDMNIYSGWINEVTLFHSKTAYDIYQSEATVTPYCN